MLHTEKILSGLDNLHKSEPGKILLLPKVIKKSYCTYTLIYRGKYSLIYEHQIKDGKTGYEVFLVRVELQKYFPSGVYLPARERWPKNEDFGRIAYYCSTLERAIARCKEMEEAR